MINEKYRERFEKFIQKAKEKRNADVQAFKQLLAERIKEAQKAEEEKEETEKEVSE